MAQSAIDVARAAMSAYQTLESFEATQKISAGAINAEARVRYKKPNMVTVEYLSYQDPLAEFEEKLVGEVEFVADELIGMQLIYDGRGTWLYDAGKDVAIYKPERALYTPLRGTNTLAEIGFLRDLTHDYLLRDAGQDEIAGRAVHRLGLKPKAQHRSFLFKEEVFSLKKATLALDAETSFPLKITYYPSRASTLFYLVGPSTPITVEYKDVRLDIVDGQRFSFTPPEGIRVFREETVPQDGLGEKLPFDLHLEILEQQEGYELYGDRATVTFNEEMDRAYASLAFVSSQETDRVEAASTKRAPGMLSLRVGNYLSRNMSRRRAYLAEHGEQVTLNKVTARFLDRGALLKDQLPKALGRKILEVSFETDGVYWFLLGEELEKETLIDVARALAKAPKESK